MLYWMHDETGRVLATENDYYPGDRWFEISPESYEANSHPLSLPIQDAPDSGQAAGMTITKNRTADDVI
jgi:hypothetical protein